MLVTRDLHWSYGAAPILSHINLGFSQPGITAILGPNGSGKSTLMQCLAGLLPVRRSQVILDGLSMEQWKPRDRARKIAYVPQSTHIDFPDTVFETVLAGRHPFAGMFNPAQDHAKVEEALDTLELSPLANRNYAQLSGGQKQRVLIARALAQDTPIIILDEPTSALDLCHQLGTMNILRSLAENQQRLVFVVLHDLTLAARYARRLILLHQGTIAADGPAPEVLTSGHLDPVFQVRTLCTPLHGTIMVLADTP